MRGSEAGKQRWITLRCKDGEEIWAECGNCRGGVVRVGMGRRGDDGSAPYSIAS